jgi:hypothetical protein
LETFDNLSSGLPEGWSLSADAGPNSLGTLASFSSSAASWGNLSGAFKNLASINNPGVSAGDSTRVQDAYTDRALGIRPTGSFGDPGAAFVFELTDTSGFASFGLSLDLEMLSVQSRSTTWSIQYRVGDSGAFNDLGSYAGPGEFGSATENFSFGSALDDQADPVFIRLAALSESTGTGSRDTIAIDNFGLSFTPVPDSKEYGLLTVVGLLGFDAWRRRRQSAASP